jgi:hypothetical protein
VLSVDVDVVIADVVDYGRLSQIDEEAPRARFPTDLKEVFEPRIAGPCATAKRRGNNGHKSPYRAISAADP